MMLKTKFSPKVDLSGLGIKLFNYFAVTMNLRDKMSLLCLKFV